MNAPFCYFGGKRMVAAEVWKRFGDVLNYVEPFFGSGAVLLARPDFDPSIHTETINDLDCMVSNFWRAVSDDHETVAGYCDWPVNENDLHARHAWLVGKKPDIRARIEGDPKYYDAMAAGWWCWGLACWIGGEFCSGKGPWEVEDGELVHLGNKGQGVNRQLVELGNKGRGVNRQLVHLGNKGRGVTRQRSLIYEWFEELSDRMRRVRVCCGDWSRVCTATPTEKFGTPIGVFLDPPYSVDERAQIYTEESFDVAHGVREWAIEREEDSRYRIALCGYEGEHELPGWSCFQWETSGGMANKCTRGSENASRERIWFSPNCIHQSVPKQGSLFDPQEVLVS